MTQTKQDKRRVAECNDIKYYLIYEQSALSDINLISDKARIVSILNSIKNDPF